MACMDLSIVSCLTIKLCIPKVCISIRVFLEWLLLIRFSNVVLSKNGSFLYGEKVDEAHFGCSVWGPTCDSIDCLAKEIRLPLLEDGDWLYWENMGAYTICAASQFNGFKRSEVLYTNTYC